MKQVFAVLGFTCLAWAQGPAASDPPALLRVAGLLTDAATGQPLRRAALTLQYLTGPRPAQALYTVTADAGGHFEISGVAPGQYRLWAERRGYPRQSFGGEQSMTLTADRADIQFRMAPFAALTGKVVDENGDAISGAAIQLIRSELREGAREFRPILSVVTDDRGEYRVASLTQGRYYVSAFARGQTASEDMVYPRRFFTGSPDLATATPLELDASANQRADFRLTPEHAFHVRGKMREWQTFTGISVALSPRNPTERFGSDSYPVRLAGEGRFDVSGVPPGQYVLTVSGYEGVSLRTASQLVAVSASDQDGIELTPQGGISVTGQVTFEAARDATPALTISLLPDDFVMRPVQMAQVTGKRSLQLPQVLPGAYTLRLNVPEPYYVKAATVGGVDALTQAVTVPDSGSLSPIDIVIGTQGGQLSGTVKVQDRPAQQCAVLLLWRSGSSPMRDKIAPTDSEGRFSLSSLAPGDYTAYAFRDVRSIEYRNSEVMLRYSGTPVQVSGGSKQAVDLKLIEN